MHLCARRWVKETKPEFVDDGGDATLERHKGTEREDAFAHDGSLLDPVCQVQIKGLNIQWVCTVSRSRVLDSPPHPPVEQYSEQQQTTYDSLVSESPPHPRTEETSPCVLVDEYDNRHIEERVPVEQYSEQQLMTVSCPTRHLIRALRRKKAHVFLSTNLTTGTSKSQL